MDSEPKRSPVTAGVGDRQFRGEAAAGVDPPDAGRADDDLPGAGPAGRDLPTVGVGRLAGWGAHRADATGAGRVAEWAALGEWLASPPPLRQLDLGVLRERLVFMGRARSRLAALESEVVGEISRRQGDAGAEEILRQDQKRSRTGARKAVRTAARHSCKPRARAVVT